MLMKPSQYHPLGPNGRKLAARRYEQQQGSSAERGYDARWKRYRKGFLLDNPICARCWKLVGEHGHVDHVRAVSGPGAPLFWAASNH